MPKKTFKDRVADMVKGRVKKHPLNEAVDFILDEALGGEDTAGNIPMFGPIRKTNSDEARMNRVGAILWNEGVPPDYWDYPDISRDLRDAKEQGMGKDQAERYAVQKGKG